MVSQRSHDQPYDPVQELQQEQSDTGSAESSVQCFNSIDTFDGHLWTGLALSFTVSAGGIWTAEGVTLLPRPVLKQKWTQSSAVTLMAGLSSQG